jgi:hypothetical protein
MVHQEVIPIRWRATRVFLHTAAVMSLVAVVGCSATGRVKQFSQSIVASLREPGETMVFTPEKTREKHSCVSYKETLLELEEVEVLPDVVISGKEINQRTRYAFCPPTPSGSLRGRIIRTVLFKGKVMWRDTTDYEFKPGTWIIDVKIGIPKDAARGAYAMDIMLHYKRKAIRETKAFMVNN